MSAIKTKELVMLVLIILITMTIHHGDDGSVMLNRGGVCIWKALSVCNVIIVPLLLERSSLRWLHALDNIFNHRHHRHHPIPVNVVEHLLYGVLDDEVLIDRQLWVDRLRNKHWQHSGQMMMMMTVSPILMMTVIMMMTKTIDLVASNVTVRPYFRSLSITR